MSEEFKPNVEVLVRLAEAFHLQSVIKKTHLFSASRTNWHSFDRYLNYIKSRNYVEYKTDKVEGYHLTETGREMFQTILKFREHLKSSKSIFILVLGLACDYLDDIVDFMT